MAVARRAVWFSDEEWSLLGGMAEAKGMTISALIRAMWADASTAQPANEALVAQVSDNVARFNSRPFTPAPKGK